MDFKTFKFSSAGILDNLRPRVNSDMFQGVADTHQKISTILGNFESGKAKIQSNLALSETGKAGHIEALAKDSYEAISEMKQQSGYRQHIGQLNAKIDGQLKTTLSTEEKLLRQLQMAEIRTHLGRMTDEEVLSVYSSATDLGDSLTTEAVESAPSFIFNSALLGPIIEASQERRRDVVDPDLSEQIWELEKVDSATRMLFTDATTILGASTDMVADIASGGESVN
jgi:hypothetical protein